MVATSSNARKVCELISRESQQKNALSLLRNCKYIGVNLEITGHDPYLDQIIRVQISTEEIVFIIDIANNPGLTEILKGLFTNERPIKIFHNAKIALKHLLHIGVNVKGVFDTMLAAQLIEGSKQGEQYTFTNIVKRY